MTPHPVKVYFLLALAGSMLFSALIIIDPIAWMAAQ